MLLVYRMRFILVLHFHSGLDFFFTAWKVRIWLFQELLSEVAVIWTNVLFIQTVPLKTNEIFLSGSSKWKKDFKSWKRADKSSPAVISIFWNRMCYKVLAFLPLETHFPRTSNYRTVTYSPHGIIKSQSNPQQKEAYAFLAGFSPILTFNAECITSRFCVLIPLKTVDLAVNVPSLTLIQTHEFYYPRHVPQSYFKGAFVSFLLLKKKKHMLELTNPCNLSNFVDFHAPWTLKTQRSHAHRGRYDKWYLYVNS